ncbi:MAG: class I SAM-dependent methyltransferase [Thermoplasmata archaeon]
MSATSARAAVQRARRALGDPRTTPSIPWLVHLTGASRAEIGEVLAEVDELVENEEMIRATQQSAGRSFYAQIRAPFDLYALVRLTRPDHLVEAGVSSGISSAHFLLALKKNRHGQLHSIDKPTFQRGPTLGPKESGVSIPPGRKSGWAVPLRIRSGWDLRIGPSQELLPRLVRELPSVGLFLHDDLHTPKHLTFELATIRPKLVPGAVVLADNTVWTGESFPRFARKLGVPWFPRGRSDLVGLRVGGGPSIRRGAKPRGRR